MKLPAADACVLDRDGFVALRSFAEPELVAALRSRVDELFVLEGDRAGSEFKQEAGSRRLANLIDKGDVFRRLLTHRNLLDYVRHVLGPEIKLSSLNARAADPASRGQPLHADMSAVADQHGAWVCNTVWMLDDFTKRNGAIRVVPGSHHRRQLPAEALDDPAAPHADEVLLTGNAGDVLVMNAHTWHGGTANITNTTRRAVHVFFCRRDKPQQQYQKALLSENVQQLLSPDLRYLLAIDDPLNNALCRQNVARSGFLE